MLLIFSSSFLASTALYYTYVRAYSHTVDYWIVCDDDVNYTPDVLIRYHYALAATGMKGRPREVFPFLVTCPALC